MFKISLTLMAVAFLSGCATFKKAERLGTTDLDYRIEIGTKDEIQIGDKIEFYSLMCRTKFVPVLKERSETCSRTIEGIGKVLEVTGPSSAVARAENPLDKATDLFVKKADR